MESLFFRIHVLGITILSFLPGINPKARYASFSIR